MTNIIKFPAVSQPTDEVHKQATSLSFRARIVGLGARIIKVIWVAIVLVWPLLKWIVSIDVSIQAVRMMYYWNTPGMYAAWTFLLHFAVLTGLTYFVSLYKPKGM